ncbi:hypothetical protein GWO43_19120, partial [candidate division KSB1 bacterium]|nr:hypothetical protein [candidate division KSB1 bacterium]NIR71222.1 hypothetical protein [candidate division KSB1 bacterium]NIS27596.1 hypothetical protein [candidate division KSB1 bacterium]NIT72947.1 hypothetical protein [candidate division KSB1 bacterium]NIW72749.1 hypothetical protein [candidate division KSB1 bacterium]
MRHKLHLVYISVLFAMPLIQSCDHSTSKAEKALTSVMMFHNLMKVSPVYKADIQKLKNSNGSFIGIPSFRSVKIFLD